MIPILNGYRLSDLDVLHDQMGLGQEWQDSDRRREIVEEITVPGEVLSRTEES